MATSNYAEDGEGTSNHLLSDSVFEIQNGEQNELLNEEPNVMRYTAPIGAQAEEYKMDHTRRGRAIIFNHEKFHEALMLEERPGTHTDKILLKQRLERLNFEVETLDDQPLSDIMKRLTDVSQENHTDADCLLIIVLTHGQGKDKLFAYDNMYKVDTLWNNFIGEKCPTLAGKPKIFIVGACRGKDISQGMKFRSSIQIDSQRHKEAEIHRYSIPVEADILVAFCTYKGRVALRNIDEGTWYIQELCEELEENGEKLDLLSLFTNVNRRVAVEREYHSLKQMPMIQSTLTRKLYLTKNRTEIVKKETAIAEDISKFMNATVEKLNYITDMLEAKKFTTPAVKTRPLKKKPVSVSIWDALKTPMQATTIAVPETDVVYKHGGVLKVFLEEMSELPPYIKDEGEFILNFLACWENLSDENRRYAYEKLVIFLNENAKDWKMYKFLDIPECSSSKSEHCHRRWSQSDATDSGRVVNKTATLPRTARHSVSKQKPFSKHKP
ncbi:caspase-3-like [Periplaneta americana]|uniref:caspase-3-like n=1 Tax=Periplaneta americana TaxID=6978 RepID=UPI0037E9B4EE